MLAGFPLKSQPGTRWNYGLSTDICARLVEILSGERFDHYLQANLFDPLGMMDTDFWVPPESLGRFAACYRYRHGGPPPLFEDRGSNPYRRLRSYLAGAGGLVSTTGDYLRFA